MTVIESHRAAVGNGIKTKLLGMLRIPGTDVLSPAEGEYLSGQTAPSGWLVPRHDTFTNRMLFPVPTGWGWLQGKDSIF